MNRRIALISEHASPLATLGGVDHGGQNVYVAQVARHLAGMGHTVDVFTRKEDPQAAEIHPWENGIRIIHVPAGPAKMVNKEKLLPYMAQFTRYMLDFIQRQPQPYDLLHANFWMSGLVAAEIKRALGIPFVITFHALGRVRRAHQGKLDQFPDERFTIEDRIVREADRIIAECPQDQEDLIQMYGADAQKITIVPAGYDPAEIAPVDKAEARARLGLAQDAFIILQLGRIVPRKGIETVIRGAARLYHDHHIESQLLVVGGDTETPDLAVTPELGRLMNIAREEKIADAVTFVGGRQRSVLKYYYSAADVFVSTPWYEPFGITPLEAMACGTPVIGAAVGGIQYTVVDGKTGYLIPPKDPLALADRLARLYHNPQLRKRFGKQAIQRVQKCFTWEIITRALAQTYEMVLSNRQPATMHNHHKLVEHSMAELIDALTRTRAQLSEAILDIAQLASRALQRGNKIMVCGNGGSAADAQHFAAELTGRFKKPLRPALPVIALNADPVILTAWANDFSYDTVFSRQVEAFGQPGDVLLLLSTSGNSKNLIEACRAAHQRGVTTLALLGKDGGSLARVADHAVIVPAMDTARIQEVHIWILHILCEIIELDLPLAQPVVHRNGGIKAGLKQLDYVLPLNGETTTDAALVKKPYAKTNKKSTEINKHEKSKRENHAGNGRSERVGRSHLP